MKEYKRILGRINCEIAAMANQVTEVIYGIAQQKKKPDTLVNRTEKPGVDSNKSGESVMCQKENRVHIIIGGAFQGKTQYATKIYPGLELTDGFNCSLDEIRNCVAINKFNSFNKTLAFRRKNKGSITDDT